MFHRTVFAGVRTGGLWLIILMLSWAVTDRAWAQAPQSAAAQRAVLDGDLEVIFEDDDSSGRLLHFLNSGNRRIPLRFVTGEEPDLPSGSHVRVTGTLADNGLSATSVTTLAVSASRTIGNQSVLVLLINFNSSTAQPYTLASAAAVNGNVRNYYIENSYGQVSVNFTLAGWFPIAAGNSTCDYSTWATQADAAAANAGITVSNYSRRVYAFPQTTACSWWGLGYLSGSQAFVNGNYATRVVAHELGHTFGNYHSHSMPCDGATCTSVDYGDDRDVLGVPGTVGHMTAFQKERLGWLNYSGSPNIQTVTASGDYWIDNYELVTGSAPKALKIWNPIRNNYYYIESRARTGFDANVAAGVTLHTADTSGNSSYQVDLAPTTSTYDSTLDMAQVFKDDAMGLNVMTVSSTASGAVVSVIVGSVACARATPTMSVTPSSPMRYTVAVSNRDGAGCSTAPFSLSASVPGGWIGSFSPSSLALAPGASGSTTLTLTAPAGTTGSFAVGLNATNSASGQSASQTVSLSLVAALNVSTSVSITGTGNRSAIIRTVVSGGGAAVAGAQVTVVVTKPGGAKTTLSATTAADGSASVKYGIARKNASGTYQVSATATANGVSGTSASWFVVP